MGSLLRIELMMFGPIMSKLSPFDHVGLNISITIIDRCELERREATKWLENAHPGNKYSITYFLASSCCLR